MKEKRLSDALGLLIQKRFGKYVERLSYLRSQWEMVVGKGFSEHTFPLRIGNRSIVIACDDPGWAHQLNFHQTEIKKRIVSILGSSYERKGIKTEIWDVDYLRRLYNSGPKRLKKDTEVDLKGLDPDRLLELSERVSKDYLKEFLIKLKERVDEDK